MPFAGVLPTGGTKRISAWPIELLSPEGRGRRRNGHAARSRKNRRRRQRSGRRHNRRRRQRRPADHPLRNAHAPVRRHFRIHPQPARPHVVQKGRIRRRVATSQQQADQHPQPLHAFLSTAVPSSASHPRNIGWKTEIRRTRMLDLFRISDFAFRIFGVNGLSRLALPFAAPGHRPGFRWPARAGRSDRCGTRLRGSGRSGKEWSRWRAVG